MHAVGRNAWWLAVLVCACADTRDGRTLGVAVDGGDAGVPGWRMDAGGAGDGAAMDGALPPVRDAAGSGLDATVDAGDAGDSAIAVPDAVDAGPDAALTPDAGTPDPDPDPDEDAGPEPVCGNGVLEAGEACDDGARDACGRATRTAPRPAAALAQSATRSQRTRPDAARRHRVCSAHR